MITLIIFLTLTISFTGAAFGIFIFTWWNSNNQSNMVARKGTLIIRVNFEKRKVMIKSVSGKQKSFSKAFARTDEWLPFERLTAFVKTDESNKRLNNLFHKLETNKQQANITIDSKVASFKKWITRFHLFFSPLEDSADYILRLKWEALRQQKERKAFTEEIVSREKIIESTADYKTFVAFNINAPESRKRLIQIIHKTSHAHEISYFQTSGFLIVVFYNKSSSSAKKRIEKFIRNMKKRGFIRGANHLFDGSSYLISNKVTNEKNFTGIIQTLDFLINISIERSAGFITLTKELKKNEFEKYIEASKSFRHSVKIGSLDVNEYPVKDFKSRRKRVLYITPTIKSINNNLLSTIVRNKNNQNLLIDSFAKKIAINQELEGKAALVDVNDYWLIKNHQKITTKKAMYIINIEDLKKTEQLREVTERLLKKGHSFGIRIKDYNEEIPTIIRALDSKYIVIDKSVWGDEKILTSNTLIKLMSVNSIAKENGAALIYENPSDIIDDVTAKKIGLNFFYSTE